MGRDAVVNSPGVESEWIASENKRYVLISRNNEIRTNVSKFGERREI